MLSKPTILHLDDHYLFATGLRQALEPFTEGFSWLHFHQPNTSISFLIEFLSEGKHLSMVFTDLNHPGDNGYEFAKQVKQIGKEYCLSIPVILVTMSTSNNTIIQKGLKEKVFDAYFTKSEDITAIAGEFNRLKLKV